MFGLADAQGLVERAFQEVVTARTDWAARTRASTRTASDLANCVLRRGYTGATASPSSFGVLADCPALHALVAAKGDAQALATHRELCGAFHALTALHGRMRAAAAAVRRAADADRARRASTVVAGTDTGAAGAGADAGTAGGLPAPPPRLPAAPAPPLYPGMTVPLGRFAAMLEEIAAMYTRDLVQKRGLLAELGVAARPPPDADGSEKAAGAKVWRQHAALMRMCVAWSTCPHVDERRVGGPQGILAVARAEGTGARPDVTPGDAPAPEVPRVAEAWAYAGSKSYHHAWRQ